MDRCSTAMRCAARAVILIGAVTCWAQTKPALSGLVNSSAAAANLTTEGSADWMHWGDGIVVRKAGVAAQLSTYALVGKGEVFIYRNDPRPLSWTDGSGLATSPRNQSGVYVNSTGNGFAFTVPADTAARTLIVHVGGWNSGATLTTHLSDGSAEDFTDTAVSTSGQYDRNYTITYTAASAGQTLTVTWKMTSGTGNVTINALALAVAPPVVPPVIPPATPPTVSKCDLNNDGKVDAADVILAVLTAVGGSTPGRVQGVAPAANGGITISILMSTGGTKDLGYVQKIVDAANGGACAL